MKSFTVKGGCSHISAALSFSGDKSIAHRGAILGALAAGITTLRNFPANEDCLSTLSIIKRLGVRVTRNGAAVRIAGRGARGLKSSRGHLLIKESGTTYRLMLGVLSGQNFSSVLSAGASLSGRPMRRVTVPLRRMGARIRGRRKSGEEYPPVSISPGKLSGITYRMPVPSAQVKSAILLAGLFARGRTTVIEQTPTRDHTERMLEAFGAAVRRSREGRGASVRNCFSVEGGRALSSPGTVTIPGDISSAAFFIVLGSIIPGSRIRIRNIGLNATRSGIITVLRRMGAHIRVCREYPGAEPRGDILVTSAILKGTTVTAREIPLLIDELPVLMVAAACARGTTVFKSAQELRVKETDRINSMLSNLSRMGVDGWVKKSGRAEDVIITGIRELRGAWVSSFGDHRTAMSMAIAGIKARGATVIDDIECINKSFPGFIDTLKKAARC